MVEGRSQGGDGGSDLNGQMPLKYRKSKVYGPILLSLNFKLQDVFFLTVTLDSSAMLAVDDLTNTETGTVSPSF